MIKINIFFTLFFILMVFLFVIMGRGISKLRRLYNNLGRDLKGLQTYDMWTAPTIEAEYKGYAVKLESFQWVGSRKSAQFFPQINIKLHKYKESQKIDAEISGHKVFIQDSTLVLKPFQPFLAISFFIQVFKSVDEMEKKVLNALEQGIQIAERLDK